MLGLLVALAAVSPVTAQTNQQFGLTPGAVFREYQQHLYWPKEWRVTDPSVERPRAIRDYLPNPIMPLEIDSLATASHAEVVLDRWGGHPGTSGKAIAFNGNDWLAVPEFETAPAGKDPRCYLYEDNPVMTVPLNNLREGRNTFQGTASKQVCMSFDWGQWGFYGLVLRVYQKEGGPHPEGEITFPASGDSLADNPLIKVYAQSSEGIDRVEVFAHYDGFDVDGDGIGEEWQGRYQGTSLGQHVGTATTAPWSVTWDTSWVPDQKAGAVKLIARVRGKSGVWYVTEPIEGLTLDRPNTSVQIARTNVADIPYRFNVRNGQRAELAIDVPDVPGMAIQAARFEVLTWNGGNGEHSSHEVNINDWEMGHVQGTQFDFAYSRVALPGSVMKTGKNVIEFSSDNIHHGPEILWPGPAIVVQYARTPSQ